DGEDDGDRSRSATRTRAAFARSFQSLHLCMSSRMWGTSQRSSGSTPLPLPENVLPELELRAKRSRRQAWDRGRGPNRRASYMRLRGSREAEAADLRCRAQAGGVGVG